MQILRRSRAAALAPGATMRIDGETVHLAWSPADSALNGRAVDGFFVYVIDARVPLIIAAPDYQGGQPDGAFSDRASHPAFAAQGRYGTKLVSADQASTGIEDRAGRGDDPAFRGIVPVEPRSRRHPCGRGDVQDAPAAAFEHPREKSPAEFHQGGGIQLDHLPLSFQRDFADGSRREAFGRSLQQAQVPAVTVQLSQQQVDHAIARAQTAWPDWSRRDVVERSRILLSAEGMIDGGAASDTGVEWTLPPVAAEPFESPLPSIDSTVAAYDPASQIGSLFEAVAAEDGARPAPGGHGRAARPARP